MIALALYIGVALGAMHSLYRGSSRDRKILREAKAAKAMLATHSTHPLGKWLHEAADEQITQYQPIVNRTYLEMAACVVWFIPVLVIVGIECKDMFLNFLGFLGEQNKSMSTDHLMTFDVNKIREERD